MIRRAEALALGTLLALAPAFAQEPEPAAAAPRAVVITGQVHAPGAEIIYAPMSESSPVTLRYLAGEGAQVQPGDPLVRIDPGASLSQQESLKVQIAQARARIDKELAELAVREIDADLALVDAEAALAKAEVDAAIPADYIARIDADRYQGEFERARRELALKTEELTAARTAVARRRSDGELEIAKMQTDLDYADTVIALAEQRAEGSGVATFYFNPWIGQRYEEGSTAVSGQAIGELVRPGALGVRAHALEPDRRGLEVGQAVNLHFDAIRGQSLPGKITAIGGTPLAKAEWGSGRYFVIDIELPQQHALPLRPGMSARVSTQPAEEAVAVPVAAATLSLDGEIAALDSASISPPSVRGVWNFQITQLATDGSTLKAGQPVVTFDGNELQRRLVDAQAQRKQKQSEQAKLLLDLAERERTDRLATAEQQANLQKAERKAEQPAELVRSVDYRKLVIEREQAARRNALMQRKEGLAQRLREAERALIASDVARAQSDVDELSRALSSLSVPAPRDGVVVVKSNWRGERYEIGSQVFMGQSVAEMPDPGTLVVRATVAERDMLRVKQGQPARIRMQGGAGQRLQGTVAELGRAVRSKSRLAPVPVLDVLVHLQGDTSGLKTGMPVVVEVDVPDAAAGVAP